MEITRLSLSPTQMKTLHLVEPLSRQTLKDFLNASGQRYPRYQSAFTVLANMVMNLKDPTTTLHSLAIRPAPTDSLNTENPEYIVVTIVISDKQLGGRGTLITANLLPTPLPISQAT